MRKGPASFCAVLAALAAASPAQAHLRNYLVNYGYYTLEKGRVEVEAYTDYRRTDSGDPDTGLFLHQTEVAYGFTDRLTLGAYGVFLENTGFTAGKAVARYRFAEKGRWPVDTGVYFEVIKANGTKSANEVELKALFSKDFGALNTVANVLLGFEEEIEPSGEKEWEVEPALTLGAAYPMGRVTPGIELLLAEDKSQVIPGLYIDLLPEIRLNLGVGVGLEKKTDDYQLKSILEVEF